MHDVERVKLKVVLVIKPGAFERIDPDHGKAGEGDRIDHEFFVGAGARRKFRRTITFPVL